MRSTRKAAVPELLWCRHWWTSVETLQYSLSSYSQLKGWFGCSRDLSCLRRPVYFLVDITVLVFKRCSLVYTDICFWKRQFITGTLLEEVQSAPQGAALGLCKEAGRCEPGWVWWQSCAGAAQLQVPDQGRGVLSTGCTRWVSWPQVRLSLGSGARKGPKEQAATWSAVEVFIQTLNFICQLSQPW